MLTSLQNPLVKQMRKLRRSKERRKQHLFLLEGTNLLKSACKLDYPLMAVCYTLIWKNRYPKLWKEAIRRSQRIELVSSEILSAIATTVNPDGVVATVSRDIVQPSTKNKLNLGLVLERLQDPGNLGTIIRTAVASNADGLWLSDDSVDIDSPKVLRSSAGAWFSLPMTVSSNIKAVIEDFHSQGVQVVATLPQASKTYWEIDFTNPTLILLGNEGNGLSNELISLADQQVKIPLDAGVESLNVAIAAALLLYEAQRQQML